MNYGRIGARGRTKTILLPDEVEAVAVMCDNVLKSEKVRQNALELDIK